MRPVQVPSPLVEAIRRHAREAYPEECCGFLLARADALPIDAPRLIRAIRRAANASEGERRRRFVIPAEELRSTERELEGTEQVVVGFYHSHPDYPARPSQFDQENAWPWYSYLVLSVTAAGTAALAAFELDADNATFREGPLVTPSADELDPTESLRGPGAR